MPTVEPKLAPVKPRATRGNQREPRLLDDLVVELADEIVQGVVLLEGGAGSGRSMALAHVAARLGTESHVVFLDEPSLDELAASGDRLVVTTLPSSAAPPAEWLRLKLAPWGADELIEYLLATRPDACGSVFARLGSAARRAWTPRLAVAVLERFLADGLACDVPAVLREHLRQHAGGDDAWRHVCRLCLSLSTGGRLLDVVRELDQHGRYEAVQKLVVPHPELWPILAAEALVEALHAGDAAVLEGRLSEDVVQSVSAALRDDVALRAALQRLLSSQREWRRHAMAASLCFAVDPQWRPEPRRKRRLSFRGWQLAGGLFPRAAWKAVDLHNSNLGRADFSGARLDGADLSGSNADGTCFEGASLVGAKLGQLEAPGANFDGANLRDAELNRARLQGASFVDADLTGALIHDGRLLDADFCGACLVRAQMTVAFLAGARFEDADVREANLRMADLSRCDLRTARLDGAHLDDARLNHAVLEDVRWPDARLKGARLHNAHLTGSRLSRADLREAVFNGAGLAEIAWEDADLRGADMRNATFHMGSSRSGLIGSPIACEGSKTGFYTDDFEDMHFKRPEEIRKANLCGADLRGANIAGLDFYLVDLRDAKLDSQQLDHVRRCGAILGKVLT